MVAIIDYGAGNLQSVKKALDFLGCENVITSDSAVIDSASHVILPGVGSFGDAMDSIRSRGLEDTIKRAADGSKPFLGICLGLQLLFEESAESPNVKGLGVFDGSITLIPKNSGLKVPHMGWNSLDIQQKSGIFDGIGDGTYFYFVHSYYLGNADSSVVAATTEYGTTIQCAVQRGKVAATQFHPEKSGEAGLKLLGNFIKE
ncbi:MAG: imidazole glycerol phosphate synthase subunit HisH [Eubacterium sp.]|nr:imidazole glycerol phosphate synthase subunit HisH [Eubacterium sp.]MBR1531938.1 imidazole glycerol phosphate synthase subunit HisH [Eubacterium sp.]